MMMEQKEHMRKYVVRNKVRLQERFGTFFIAVEYRDVRGGIVVDADKHLGTLSRRTKKYDWLVIGTIDNITSENRKEYGIIHCNPPLSIEDMGAVA